MRYAAMTECFLHFPFALLRPYMCACAEMMKKVGSCLYLYSMVLLWHINAIYEGIRKKVAKKA